ncbi:MAG: flagellar basal body rod protein FlgC [Phycisphaeraceae bacterium]
MFGSLDISTSALVAQRTRLNVIASNLANQHTVFDAEGNYSPYRRKFAVFAAGDPANGNDAGVHVRDIMEDDAPFRKIQVGVGNPLADKDGFMEVPNIDPMTEMVNALEATRAYEANITAAEATKSMMNSALRLLA